MNRQFGNFFPGGGSFGPPQGGPYQGNTPSSQQQPPGPPPSFTPQSHVQQGGMNVKAVDPGAIQGCLYRWTYIWLRDNQQFWFYLIFVGGRSVAGFRWYGRRWRYYGIDVNRIVQFQCY